jgi:peptidoglycan/LPS O-acetylase OafA/YrhL
MLLYEIYQKRLIVLNSLILLGCLIISVYHAALRAELQTEHYHTYFSALVIGSVIVVSYVTMYLMAIGKLNRINSPALLKLGILTYPLYLVHQNIGFILFNNLGEYINKYLLFVLILALMLVMAYVINKLIEVPVSGFIRAKSKRLKTFFKPNSD